MLWRELKMNAAFYSITVHQNQKKALEVGSKTFKLYKNLHCNKYLRNTERFVEYKNISSKIDRTALNDLLRRGLSVYVK